MISVEHLTKCYGDFMAVQDLSFEIDEGHVYGFLGPNGAGKTTTMNIMTGCLSATEGHVRIDGYDIFEEPYKAKKLIGYLPEHPPLYMNETPLEYLTFVGEAKGLRGEELKKQIQEVMQRTKITDVMNRRISALSKGYRQRVGIAQALLGNPKVIILDEPTVGLDPLQIIKIRDLIKELGRTHTVIFSSHILSEVQAVCDRVIIISRGKIVADKRTEDIATAVEGNRRISAKICGPQKEVLQTLRAITGVVSAEAVGQHDADSITYIIESQQGVDIRKPLFSALAKSNYPLIGLEPVGMGLEDVFLSLVDAKEPATKSRRKTVSRRSSTEVKE